jgi:hypothetical protein
MIRLGTKTRKEGVQVLDQAVSFFGPQGLGLEVERRTTNSIYFVGGGGHVQITVSESNGETDVDVQSREWDYQAKQFIGKI